MHNHRALLAWAASAFRPPQRSHRGQRAVIRIRELLPQAPLSTSGNELSRGDLQQRIAHYERAFGMTSEQFLTRWQAGEAPDTYEANVWAMLLDVL